MKRRPCVSPRGAETGRPFWTVAKLTRTAAGYEGRWAGLVAVVERDPDDPAAVILRVEIRSAMKTRRTTKQRYSWAGLRREKHLMQDSDLAGIDAEASE